MKAYCSLKLKFCCFCSMAFNQLGYALGYLWQYLLKLLGPSSSHIKTLVLLCLQNGALSYSEKDRSKLNSGTERLTG
ncbi:hypothetical protein QQP08_025444 [Theobroma cacao]|nr:hypothetical protein QQP08_025444 [Theobroma cacao]